MKWLALFLFVEGFVLGAFNDFSIRMRESGDIVAPKIPTYTIEVPRDHFDESNRDTFQNRYFINDTYYKEGGPVILLAFGEKTATKRVVASYLADFYGKHGDVESSALSLARELGGLVVGWEHRYYGRSLVVDHDNETGLPLDGVSGYRYLTVQQAMQDMVYFANNFNKTTLDKNERKKDPENLGPYHSPWIIMGGSYSGSLAAWSRQKYPEIFYAAWSSDAPLQAQEDGSLYNNAIARHLPQNCTNDLEAVVRYFDRILRSGDADALLDLSNTLGIVRSNGTEENTFYRTPIQFAIAFDHAITFKDYGSFQNLGALHTTRPMCDYMETFDWEQYLRDASSAEDVRDMFVAITRNPGGVDFSSKGVAETHGQEGGRVAWHALMFGIWKANNEISKFRSTRPRSFKGEPGNKWDSKSWSWQARTQLGKWQGSNSSVEYQIVSSYYNVSAIRDRYVNNVFKDLPGSEFPEKINNTELLEMGGWNMRPSNVMFGVGEDDPWRAFGVATEEQAYGAPKRTLTNIVPKCNEPVGSSDVFGILYPGAVHMEDMITRPWLRGSLEKKTPVQQGVELFVKAWETWQPCFNQNRDAPQNGSGADDSDKGLPEDASDDEGRGEGGDDDGRDNGTHSTVDLDIRLAAAIAGLVCLATI